MNSNYKKDYGANISDSRSRVRNVVGGKPDTQYAGMGSETLRDISSYISLEQSFYKDFQTDYDKVVKAPGIQNLL